MNSHPNIEERIWDYIDGLSSAEEKGFVEQLIATQEEWRSKYHELLDVHQLMGSSIELDAPSMRFGQNVMEEIARHQIAPATKTYINKKIIYGFAAFFITMIVGLFIYGLSQAPWTVSGNSNILSDFSLEKIQWNKFFNNTYMNIFIMVNVILGLMLLDSYLTRKKQEMHKVG
ncbi:MAG: hypothetical protein H7Y27_16555 [Gemmatimonadaceae bacterium]|nr:hypothetical protein [Chitinophagaceae bacterium]